MALSQRKAFFDIRYSFLCFTSYAIMFVYSSYFRRNLNLNDASCTSTKHWTLWNIELEVISSSYSKKIRTHTYRKQNWKKLTSATRFKCNMNVEYMYVSSTKMENFYYLVDFQIICHFVGYPLKKFLLLFFSFFSHSIAHYFCYSSGRMWDWISECTLIQSSNYIPGCDSKLSSSSSRNEPY